MKQARLDHFVEEISKIWGPLNSNLVKKSKELVEDLIKDSSAESWMIDLIKEQLPAKEIYRSKQHGFVLMGHLEKLGDMSPPHDHGSGWVIYAVLQGESKMGLFNRVFFPDGTMDVVQKEATILKAGECSVYLPGDIHNTHTLKDNTVMLRLTSCDFHKELEEGRLIRYLDNVTIW
ncbi:hypothetical protein [uncultured Tenacibaculum sp.]|uniref:hypothetical protein n=1 Tax=uncultured Tenacibaculum sp. TaxID=174713 RepID=UPI002612BF2D|nr:hypothetical protein [uncultured Tenacibaculum sp.]